MISQSGFGSYFLALLTLVVSQTSAFAGPTFNIMIDGSKQGQFKGESTRADARNKISGVRYNFEVTSARDVSTGMASGKRQYHPIFITKEWGAASPQIMQALATNEVLKSVIIEFFHAGPNGAERVYQTIHLTNASIVSAKQYSDKLSSDTRDLEDVGFTFQKIEIQNLEANTSFTDMPFAF